MNKKIIPNFSVLTDQEAFLYLLEGRYFHFIQISQDDMLSFLQRCCDIHLLQYMKQREHCGEMGVFKVLQDFSFQVMQDQWGNSRAYNPEEGDKLVFTELVLEQHTKTGFMNLHKKHYVWGDPGDDREAYYQQVEVTLWK